MGKSAQRDRTLGHAGAGAPDRGATFVELLVAVVLIGIVVVAVVAGTRATVVASRVNRDHSSATAWLQSASDVLYGETRAECGTLATIKSFYDPVVQSTPNSEGWPASRIRVTDVKFWNGQSFGTTCNDHSKTLQLITLVVVDADSRPLESVQIVKGGEVGEVGGAD